MDPMSPEAHGWSVLQKLNEQKSMGLFCDVSLMVEGKIFLAHKNVLSACSEYFYAALKRNEQQQFLVLDNVSLEGFSHLLDFIYTYKIPTCHVQDFMQAGQQLQVSLPLTSQVVSAANSPPTTNIAKEEICIPDEDYEAPKQESEPTDVDHVSVRRNISDNTNINSSIYTNERRRFEAKGHLKDKVRMHKRPSFYKETFAVRNQGYFMNKQAAKSGRLGRASPVDEAKDTPFLGPAFSLQMPITIHNDGSSEEGDDDTVDCINLCDEPDTPDSSEPTVHRDLRLLDDSAKPKIYTTIVGLQVGGVVERVEGEENLAEVLHKCDRCELLLPYPEFLNHQDDPGINLLQCSFCEKQFNYSCQLALHQTSHQEKQFYQCSECGKELSTLKTFHEHIAYHSEARPHKCHLCDKAYKIKSDLTQHIKVKHIQAPTGKTPLLQLCEFCGQAVKHYKSHKIFCSGVKKFKCDFCVQSFHRISELKRHTWTHTGELPYRCKICGKGCRHPSNMKKHIRTVHKADMRVQINREHASPRFCKNRRPVNKFLAPAEVQSASHSLPGPAPGTDQMVQRDSLAYIPIYTGDEQSANDFTHYESQGASSEAVRTL